MPPTDRVVPMVVGLTFLFGLGNVWAPALRLGVPGLVALLVLPAVDLSVPGLPLAIRNLAPRSGRRACMTCPPAPRQAV